MSDKRSNQQLPRQMAGGVLWGLFFILAPAEILVLGAVAWLPVLIWRERVRAVRYGFLPGIVAWLGVVMIVVTVAALAPTKHEDRRVGPLARTDTTLGELEGAGVIYALSNPQHEALHVRLPSTTPTRREVMQAIAQQTGFRASIFHCGNGATILFGSGGGRIRVANRQL